MFSCSILDIRAQLTLEQKRFYGCMRLVADEVRPAVFYFNSDWGKMEVLRSVGIDINFIKSNLYEIEKRLPENLLESVRNILPNKTGLDGMPRIVYLEDGSWEVPEEALAKLPVRYIRNDFVLSPDVMINRAALLEQGMNANSAILCLAATGIDLLLPNFSIDHLADHEISEIRENYGEERVAYINAISSVAHTAMNAFRDGDIDELRTWARNEAIFSISPKARTYEVAVSKYAKKSLIKAGYSFWRNGIPAIGAAYLSGGLVPAVSVAGAQTLQSLVQAISTSNEEKNVPEVSYAMKIAKGRS